MGLPVEINPLFVSSTGGYQVGRSLRFRSSATAYLNRTPAAASNQRTWTWSAWVKRGTIGTNQVLFGAGTNGSSTNLVRIGFISDSLQLYVDTGAANYSIITTAVYRDPSAWYHIVAVLDTTQATAASRMLLYVNGVQVTAFSTANYTPQNNTYGVNSTLVHNIGRYVFDGTQLFDGYMAEMNFIDGAALTASSFGAYDINGVWQPAKYTGTYGTNGFYLPFSNTSSTSTLVADASGNGNNWTPNNISLTAGTTYDSMIDSPTVGAGASNYCVLNPLKSAGSNGVNSGNLNFGTTADGASGNGDNSGAFGSIAVSSGKWYFEATKLNTTTNCNLPGFASTNCIIGTDDPGLLSSGKDFFGFSWNSGGTVKLFIRQGGVSTNIATGLSQAQNDVFALAIDLTNSTIAGYKNGVQQGTTTSFTATTNLIAPCIFQTTTFNYAGFAFNFGQRPFSYTPPTGYSALNTYNLPAATINNGAQYMAATLYTGTGAAFTLTNGGNTTIGTTFQPDFVWQKSRSAIANHFLADSVRGVNKELLSDSTIAEATSVQYVTSFNSNGFSFGTDTGINTNAATYVAWQWKAGGTAVTNTSGSITSTVSASASSGFSVVTYTGTGANATVGHGLGVAPSMVIVKSRSSGVYSWAVYHASTGSGNYLTLNATTASTALASMWNSTSPTSSVFSVGTDNWVNASAATYVAYCFAAVRGYSAFGSYTGNGSTDGPFIYTGFRPRFIMVKRTTLTTFGDWEVRDTSRDPYNGSTSARLFPDLTSAEDSSGFPFDILSNGFKIRNTGVNSNESSQPYIYAAFAENPFNSSRAR